MKRAALLCGESIEGTSLCERLVLVEVSPVNGARGGSGTVRLPLARWPVPILARGTPMNTPWIFTSCVQTLKTHQPFTMGSRSSIRLMRACTLMKLVSQQLVTGLAWAAQHELVFDRNLVVLDQLERRRAVEAVEFGKSVGHVGSTRRCAVA